MKALYINGHTLIGVSGDPPHDHGNCFDVKADDGEYYKIVNFNLENLEALIDLGLKWPIELKALGERTATIYDPRIGERWYQKRYCEICTPHALLPAPQLDAQEREVLRGRRIEGNGYVQYNLTVEPEFK